MKKNTSESINKYSHLTLREREEIALGLGIVGKFSDDWTSKEGKSRYASVLCVRTY